MGDFLHAVAVFFERLAAVHWDALGIAILCHFAKTIAVTRAWRNVVAAAYPEARVRWRSIFGAHVAGVGVNSVLPARAGDPVRLYLAKRPLAEGTYTTLASTLVVLTVFDMAIASALLLWALALGVLPGLDVLPTLPAFDIGWLLQRPRLAAVLAVVVAVALVSLVFWAARRIRAFKRRVAQGFWVLRDRRAYLRRVLLLQAVDWSFRLATIYWFMRAFEIPATARNALLVQVTQSLATIVPFSPGGIGTEQALVVYVLRGDASAAALLSFSVGMKIAIIAVNAILGFGAMAIMLKTLRWRRPPEDDAASPETEPAFAPRHD